MVGLHFLGPVLHFLVVVVIIISQPLATQGAADENDAVPTENAGEEKKDSDNIEGLNAADESAGQAQC